MIRPNVDDIIREYERLFQSPGFFYLDTSLFNYPFFNECNPVGHTREYQSIRNLIENKHFDEVSETLSQLQDFWKKFILLIHHFENCVISQGPMEELENWDDYFKSGKKPFEKMKNNPAHYDSALLGRVLSFYTWKQKQIKKIRSVNAKRVHKFPSKQELAHYPLSGIIEDETESIEKLLKKELSPIDKGLIEGLVYLGIVYRNEKHSIISADTQMAFLFLKVTASVQNSFNMDLNNISFYLRRWKISENDTLYPISEINSKVTLADLFSLVS